MKKSMFSNFPLLTSGIKGWKLAKFAFSDEKKKYRIKQQYKSFFLAMFNPFFAKKWFNKINSSEFSEILFFRPRLFLKPFKAYMSITWTKEQKMKVIIDTYTFLLSKKGKRNLISQEIVISKFLLKDGTEARVIIGYDDRYRKEGEIVMSLFCGELHGVISSIAFSFEEQSPDHWVCWIGCLQGRPQTEGTYVTKKAQKLMYGIRPKALLFELLQKLINDLDIKEIYGIGDGIQAQKRKHFIHLPRLHTIAFSYDGFWNELGGDYQEDGWYRLPVKTVRKDINNIKSHKRAYYKKRYELVNLILLDIEEFLSR
ncbi:hypothetical protein SAMN05444360_11388 [Chryseobacterium carnipullorum]|uniref:DUF535 family protein n=1 Tax=Chryseobacterium carnipullorum TaxID=1124835 RepID=UPI00091253CB|nr:DUF535 family protein [Chryseobacterium carnipullorum]SHM53392.1 hypothetical protein SAMN05444360_11388 [Chryseobacterium carnipullorum]